jgi:predicted phage terminase large subunit-like protein
MDYNFLDYGIRRQMAKNLWGFSNAYLAGGMTLKPAEFHREMVTEMGSPVNRRLEILGFRSSAKSFYGSLALPLWAALEHPDLYPFIVLIGDKFSQASQTIANLKNELDNNYLLKTDYGVIVGNDPEKWKLEGPEWQKQNLLLSNGVRIIARSRGQKIRGLRHRYARPSLVVLDDPEDLEWIKTKENRDKSEQWLLGEVIPGMEERQGKLILIGNLLHADGLLARMKPKMQKVLEYSLVKDYLGSDWRGMWEHCTWKEKYPTRTSLKKQADLVGPVSFSREYLLKIVAEEGQIIKPEDVHYYDVDKLPEYLSRGLVGHGIDLAASREQSGDFTAVVSGGVRYVDGDNIYEHGKTPKIFVRPNPFHKKVQVYQLIDHLRNLFRDYTSSYFYVEANGMQKVVVDELIRALLPVKPMQPKGDKWARLQVIAQYIRNGTVLFPRTGCEELLQEVFGLGTEAHDDLVDALCYVVIGLVETGLQLPTVWRIDNE